MTLAEMAGAGLVAAGARSVLSNPIVDVSGDDSARPHLEHEVVPGGCASSQWEQTIFRAHLLSNQNFSDSSIMSQNSRYRNKSSLLSSVSPDGVW